MSSGCFSQVKQGLNKIIHGEDFLLPINFKHDIFYVGFAEAPNSIWSTQNMIYFTTFTEKEIIEVTHHCIYKGNTCTGGPRIAGAMNNLTVDSGQMVPIIRIISVLGIALAKKTWI